MFARLLGQNRTSWHIEGLNELASTQSKSHLPRHGHLTWRLIGDRRSVPLPLLEWFRTNGIPTGRIPRESEVMVDFDRRTITYTVVVGFRDDGYGVMEKRVAQLESPPLPVPVVSGIAARWFPSGIGPDEPDDDWSQGACYAYP